MSLTLCIKYALARVTKEDITWVFNELFGEDLVTDVTELVKQDRYSGKDFKMFFIKCDKAAQTKGKLDKLEAKITKDKMAKVTCDSYGHFWQVSFAIEKPKPAEVFKPRIMDEEVTVEALEAAMESLQTDDERAYLHGRKRGAAEEGEVEDNKRAYVERVFGKDDPIVHEALQSAVERMESDARLDKNFWSTHT